MQFVTNQFLRNQSVPQGFLFLLLYCFTLHGAPVFNMYELTGRSQLAVVYNVLRRKKERKKERDLLEVCDSKLFTTLA